MWEIPFISFVYLFESSINFGLLFQHRFVKIEKQWSGMLQVKHTCEIPSKYLQLKNSVAAKGEFRNNLC